MQNESLFLLLRYTIPALNKCSDATNDEIEAYAKQVSRGEIPEGNIEKRSKFAALQISKIAKEKGKAEPDAEDIRDYFWYSHNKLIDYFSKTEKKPADEFCKIYVGTVLKVMDDTAVVSSRLGEEERKITFMKGIKIGDIVVMHRDYVVEKINKETAIKIDSSWSAHRTKARIV